MSTLLLKSWEATAYHLFAIPVDDDQIGSFFGTLEHACPYEPRQLDTDMANDEANVHRFQLWIMT